MDGLRLCLAAAALLALAACEPTPEPEPPAPPAPPSAPAPEPDAPALDPTPRAASEASTALAVYYRRLEADLLQQGLLRGDGGGPDTPVTDSMLARNFLDIAFRDELTTGSEGLVRSGAESVLRRWEGPVRLRLHSGATVDDRQARRDRASLDSYLARLARLTGRSVTRVESGANFDLFIVDEDERQALGPSLSALGLDPATARAVATMPRSDLCLVVAWGGAAYTRAVAVIRAELPDLLRLECLHEEIAQGLGLANDSPRARPSLFNDNDEFGLLTRHDELLLRLLYDPRLRPGMTADEAGPMVRTIAAELVPDEVASR